MARGCCRKKTSNTQVALKGYGCSNSLGIYFKPFRDILNRGFDLGSLSQDRSRNTFSYNDWAPKGALRIDDDLAFRRHRIPPDNLITARELQTDIQAWRYDLVKRVLTFNKIQKLRFADLLDNLGKDAPAIRPKASCRKWVILLKDIASALSG